MAYIKEIPIKKTLQAAIDYITRPEKTKGQTLISDSGIPFMFAGPMWKKIREKYGKDDKILAHHFVQSFDPKHNITVEEAQKIGKELAEKQFGRLGFDYIVATHTDNGIIHNHILVNNVSGKTGDKYHHNKKTYRFLRQLNIDVCRDNGIPAVDNARLDEFYDEELKDIKLSRSYSSKPYNKTKSYDSWSEKQSTNKDMIRKDINKAIERSDSWEDFVGNMKKLGYRVDDKTKSGEFKKYVTYFPPNAERGRRDRSLGTDYYSREAIVKRIERNMAVKVYRVPKAKKKVVSKTQKTQYLLNPKWERVYFSLKTKYRRRGRLEQLLITKFLKKAAPEYAKRNTEKAVVIDNAYYQKTKERSDKVLAYLQLIRDNQIRTEKDIDHKKRELFSTISLLDSEMDQLKKNLLDRNNIDLLYQELHENEKYYKEYEACKPEERKEYYYKNKKQIQKYQIIKRELRLRGMSEDAEQGKEVRELEEAMDVLTGKRRDLTAELEDWEQLTKLLRNLNNTKENVKISNKKKERINRNDRNERFL